MATKDKMNRLEDAISTAGKQWNDEDLYDILALLEKDYTKPQPAQPEKGSGNSLESVLPDLRRLMDEEERASGARPHPGQREESAPEPGFVTPEPHQAEEERPEEEAPEKPGKKGPVLPLALIAAAEAAAVVLLVLWWRQWSL